MNMGIVFGFIFTIIVIGFLLTSGADMIKRIFGLEEDIQVVQQIDSLRKAVYTDSGQGIFWSMKGSTDAIEIRLSSNIETICFFDPARPSKNPAGRWLPDKLIESQIKAKNYTLGIFKKGGGFDGYKIEKLLPSSNFCIGTASQLALKNAGRFVDIKPEG